MTLKKETNAHLYVHFPFCESKCHYCDFYSIGREQTKSEDAVTFKEALYLESQKRVHELSDHLKTIFFGGGTPSMTDAADMAYALKPLMLDQRISAETEWTMEANPSSIDGDRLKEYRSLGINRISLGVQSTHESYLKSMGRVHSHDTTKRALEAIFHSGFNNVSVDLLCGIPGQTLEELKTSVETLTQYPITHLSCYLLTLPKGHFLYKQLPEDSFQLEHLLHLDELMRTAGFSHYEISNFSKEGYEARHNLAYWTHQGYTGLGPSAHSFDQAERRRFRNMASLPRYAASLSKGLSPEDMSETLTELQFELEKWMLALRLDRGVPFVWLKSKEQLAKYASLEKNRLVVTHPSHSDRFRLTPKGFALSDSVISALTLNL